MAQSKGRRPASDAPESAARFVRRSAPAIRARHVREGKPISLFRAECFALVEWAQLANKLAPLDAVERFRYFGSGAEHRVYYDEANNRAIKATSGGRFGHSVFAIGAGATPAEYLFRLAWHNRIFGDAIRLVSVSFDGEQHVEVVHSQPWIYPHEIRPAPFPEEIEAYLASFGFDRLSNIPTAPLFYNKPLNLLVADAHEANVIRDRNEEIVAIDVVIGYPGPSLLVDLENGTTV
jgi:hypothetical protein